MASFRVIAYDRSNNSTSIDFLDKLTVLIVDYPPSNLNAIVNRMPDIRRELFGISKVQVEGFTDDWDRKIE